LKLFQIYVNKLDINNYLSTIQELVKKTELKDGTMNILDTNSITMSKSKETFLKKFGFVVLL